MSDNNVCPKCGHRIEYHTASGCQHGTGQGCFCNCELSANDAVHLNALAEIARLKAALEKAETEIANLRSVATSVSVMTVNVHDYYSLKSDLEKAEADRDKYRDIRDVVWNKVLSLRSELQSSRNEKERIYQEWLKMYEQRNEARKLLVDGKIGLLQHYISERDAALAEVERLKSTTKHDLAQSLNSAWWAIYDRDEARRWAFSLLRRAEYWRGRSCNG